MKLDSRRLLKNGDKLYIVSRIISEDSKPIISAWNSALGTDTVLRKNGVLHFCESIIDVTDVEYINDIEPSDTPVETPADVPPDVLSEQPSAE